jgi:hypothetical protein
VTSQPPPSWRRKDGGQVFAWAAGKALEQELFAAVPDQAAKALLDLAIEHKDRDAVQAHIENVSAKAASLAAIEAEFVAGGLGVASRTVLGNAAARYVAGSRLKRRWRLWAKSSSVPSIGNASPA